MPRSLHQTVFKSVFSVPETNSGVMQLFGQNRIGAVDGLLKSNAKPVMRNDQYIISRGVRRH